MKMREWMTKDERKREREREKEEKKKREIREVCERENKKQKGK